MLQVKDLRIEFYDHSVPEVAVRDVDFTMDDGEIVGLVGESGSGKSLTATAIAGLIRRGDVKISGEIWWDDTKASGTPNEYRAEGREELTQDTKEEEKGNRIDLLRASRKTMRSLQGNEIGFIFQDPMTAFSPVHKIGYQVEDALRVHGKTTEDGKEADDASDKRKAEFSGKELKERAIRALKDVDLPDPERVYDSYPFELSGGMRQRAMIASAMISGPRLLIADEPTTALDVTVQAEIIKLLKRINREDHTAILFISHDLGLVKKLCDKVLVLKDGDVVEQGLAAEIFQSPKAEYTKKLIAAEVSVGRNYAEGSTGQAEGNVSKAEGNAGQAEGEAKHAEGNVKHAEAEQGEAAVSADKEMECIVNGLTYYYPKHIEYAVNRKNKGRGTGNPTKAEPIGIKDIHLTVHKGEIVGLVGESGSGKSTLAKCIVGLIPVEKGRITRNKAGMIFQDSYSALNPGKKVEWLLRESLRLNGVKNKNEQKKRIEAIMEEVELPSELLLRRPAELSGGQRQRVMIAMALLQNPTFLVADEPVSALDVAIQESITRLLLNLSRRHGVAILFISHDLRTVYTLCDRVCVMKEGRIVEEADKEELYNNPKEEYTKVLLRSALE